MARKTGIQASTISNYRQGKDMKASHVVAICLQLNMSADELLGLPSGRDDELYALINELTEEQRRWLTGMIRAFS